MSKKKSKFNVVEIGDILLMSNGRLSRVVDGLKDLRGTNSSYFVAQFIDQNGETAIYDDGTLDIERNLGQSDEVLTHFYAAQSIHLRLNEAKGLFGET